MRVAELTSSAHADFLAEMRVPMTFPFSDLADVPHTLQFETKPGNCEKLLRRVVRRPGVQKG